MRGFKQQNEELAQNAQAKKQADTIKANEPVKNVYEEEKKETKQVKSPFSQTAGQTKDKGPASPPKQHKDEDEIEEDIIQDIEDI